MKMDDMAIQWNNIGVFCLFAVCICCAWKAWRTAVSILFLCVCQALKLT